MALRAGSRVGHFEVTGLLGVGGMGQVYRATDTKLRRDVALKILPDAFAADPDRVARFEREAQALAALNHSGIAAIYGIEESAGALALILELVPGPTLEDRIARGPIPVAEALRLAIGIASAIEAAHERGIIHRDLKPANIKVRNDGTVKVLDFGLAKALSLSGVHAAAADSTAPTEVIEVAATAPGLILGTAAYMSPEQARGESVDERTDVWALGCILFEMLTGRAPFGRERATDILANVLKEEPDFSALPPDTPPLARRLLRRCLEKDRRERLRHIGDARADLRDSLAAAGPGVSSGVGPVFRPSNDTASRRPATSRRSSLVAAAVVVLVAIGALAGWLIGRRGHASLGDVVAPVSFEISGLPIGTIGASIAVSPDGRQIAHASPEALILRSIEHAHRDQARWDGSREGARGNPFFSPDGKWIGFFTGFSAQLGRVSARGGTPVLVGDLGIDARVLGASWGEDDNIVLATTVGLHRVASSGGAPELLLAPDSGRGEVYFAVPEVLPGAGAVLFTVTLRDGGRTRVDALDLASRQRSTVLQDGSRARYSSGRLVYIAGGRLQVIAFDAGTLQTSGDSQVLLDQSALTANFDLSDAGNLVYEPLPTAENAEALVWVDRTGRQTPIAAPAGSWVYPRISPDGKKVACDRFADGGRDIYIWDFERESLSRLTDDPREDVFPHWSSDGSRLLFSSNRTGAAFNLYSRAADGSGRDELLFDSDVTLMPWSLTPDGSVLLVGRAGPNRFDLAAVDLANPREARVLLATAADEKMASVSPDGRFMAYESNDEGQSEIFVAPFPDIATRRWKISRGGGSTPLWSSSGGEIFFRGATGNMMAARVELEPTFVPGAVTELFPNPSRAEFQLGVNGRRYDVSPIDGRFLMAKEPDRSRGSSLVVVLNALRGAHSPV